MATEHGFILDLVTALGAATVGGFLANRLRQPVLLGYLASGLIIGPYGFKLLGDVTQVKSLAEIGVAFLLFALGVEFSIAELKRFKDIALKGSLLQIGLTTGIIAILSLMMGWVKSPMEGIFLGALLSLSSTAVVLKTLTERGETNTPHGQVMLAILIAQDLVLGLMLAIVPALSETGSAIGIALLQALIKGVIFAVGALAAGIWLVPRFMKTVAATESSELFLLAVIALCLGVALITDSLGLSIEMGAFIAGLMISEIDYADQALAKILPLRDTFASLFFASIGMLINQIILINNIGVLIGFFTIVIIGKTLIILTIILGFGYSFRTAVIASLGLNQIGEFSFVLAQVGLSEGILSEKKYLLILGTTAITLLLTPLLLKWSSRLAEEVSNLPILKPFLRRFRDTKEVYIPETLRDHVVIAGYGRVGQTLVNMLHNQGRSVLVIENSEAAVQHLRSQGIPYVLGDADSELVLEKVHLGKALALAIALPDPASTRLLLQRALALSPELDIVVRAHENSEIEILMQLGAWEVVQPEFEAALEMGAHLLSSLGETQTTIQSVIRSIRADRYRSILPQRVTNIDLKALQEITEGMNSEWTSLDPNSPLVGMTLAEADIRHLTGVTIMEIERQNKKIHYPKGDLVLEASDRLLILGSKEELSAFRDLIEDLGKINTDDLDWITLSKKSPLLGKMLTATDLEGGNKGIIALRQQGKLYKTLMKPRKLKAGDLLLVHGKWQDIEQSLAQEKAEATKPT